MSRNPSWIDFYGESINEMVVDDEAFERTQEIEDRMTQAALAEVRFMSAVWDRDYAIARQEIEAVIQETTRADEKLSGWHNLWLGICLECEEDYEAAQEEYLRAYQRLSKKVIVPRKIGGDPHLAATTQTLTDFERQIDLIVERRSPKSYQKTLQRLRSSIAGLDDPSVSIPQQEEALRALGEYLGFAATRPDNDDGTGPDVLWVDENSQKCLAFELKTGKKSNPVYCKKDIEQGHDHLEWIRQNYQNCFCLGLVYVGSYGKRDKAANPSAEMYLCEMSVLVCIKNQLVSGIEDLRAITPTQRRAKVTNFCSELQWKLEGLASKVKINSIQSLEVSS